MADIIEPWKSPRVKKQQSKRLQGYYLTGEGHTVLMSATRAASCDESAHDDDSTWKIKARRKKKPAEDDDIKDEPDNENQKDDTNPTSPGILDDEPNLQWHILPENRDLTDDNTELYSEELRKQRATINILAEIHSASPPGFVSPKSAFQITSNSSDVDTPKSTVISPVTSPSKNGCVVSRDDKIFFHKRIYHGSPVRKSSRIQKTSFKKPDAPKEQIDISASSESQLSTHLAAGSSVVDSPLSDVSISPAGLTPDISVDNRNERNVKEAKSDDVIDGDNEEYTDLKRTTGATNAIMDENLYVEHPQRDPLSTSDDEARSKATDVQIIDVPSDKKEDDDIQPERAPEVQNEEEGDAISNKMMNYDTDPDDEITSERKERGKATNGINNRMRESDNLDKSDILETLMDMSPLEKSNENKVADVRASKGARIVTEQAKAKEGITTDERGTFRSVAVQENSGTVCDIQMQENYINHDTSLNTSTGTDDFVSADEMPLQSDLPRGDETLQETVEHAEDEVPRTPPMSPTKKGYHLDEMRKSMTKSCKVMLTNTPTPPRYIAKFESTDNVNRARKETDVDDHFYSMDSGEEEQQPVKRKKSQRRKSIKSLTQIMEEENDSDFDLPIFSTKKKKKKGFASQFQKFFQLTKDLDDTPSDKGTPVARAEEVFQDSPATLLTQQLCSFSLETPVSKQLTQDKKNHSARKMSLDINESPSSSSSPLKRKHSRSQGKESKQIMTEKKTKKSHRKKKESKPEREDVVLRTPERQKIIFPSETPLTPLVNLAKESDMVAIQEYCSPNKLQVKVVSTPPKKFCSPVSVSLKSSIQSLMEHLSPHKYKVAIESPSTKVLQEVCNSKNFRISLSKDEIQATQTKDTMEGKMISGVKCEKPASEGMELEDVEKFMQENDPVYKETEDPEDLLTRTYEKKTIGQQSVRKRTSRSRRRSTNLVPHSANDKELVAESAADEDASSLEVSSQSKIDSKHGSHGDTRNSVTKEIECLGNEMEQVTLHSTRKKRMAKRSSASDGDPKISSQIENEGEGDVVQKGKDDKFSNLEQLGNEFNPFPLDDENEEKPVRPRGRRKSKVAGRRRSTRLLQSRQWKEDESIRNAEAWERESIISEPPPDRPQELYSFRANRAVSYAGSACQSDAESLASVDTFQTDDAFNDLDFEVPEFTQRRSSRRRSVRIAKRKSLQLGKFDTLCKEPDVGKGKLSSVGLSEEEVKQLNSAPASTRKRTWSRSSRNDDVQSVSSVGSSVIFCGVFTTPKASEAKQGQESNEEEKQLWDDFNVEFDDDEPQRKPKKTTKQKKKQPSRRMSSRLRGGCASFMELDRKGEVHEVIEDVIPVNTKDDEEESKSETESLLSQVVPEKRSRRRKKNSEIEREVNVVSETADVESVDIADDEELGTTKNRGRRKRSASRNKEISERVTVEDTGDTETDIKEDAPEVFKVVSMKNSRRVVSIINSRRQKKASENQTEEDGRESVTSEDGLKSDAVLELSKEIPRHNVGASRKNSRRRRKGGTNQSEVETDGMMSREEETEITEAAADKLIREAAASVESEDVIRDDVSVDMPAEELHDVALESALMQSSTEDGKEDTGIGDKQTAPLKKERQQKKRTRSRRKSSRSFQPTKLEEIDKVDEVESKTAPIPSESVEEAFGPVTDVDDILTNLEVGNSPSSVGDPEPQDSHDGLEGNGQAPTSFDFELLIEHEIDTARDINTVDHMEVSCDFNTLSTEILQDGNLLENCPPEAESNTAACTSVEKTKKQRKSKRKTLQISKPAQREEADMISTGDVMMLGGEVDQQQIDADDILSDLKLGASPSKNDEETNAKKERSKKAKKGRRRSSNLFKPVDLEALQDHHHGNDVALVSQTTSNETTSVLNTQKKKPRRSASSSVTEDDFDTDTETDRISDGPLSLSPVDGRFVEDDNLEDDFFEDVTMFSQQTEVEERVANIPEDTECLDTVSLIRPDDKPVVAKKPARRRKPKQVTASQDSSETVSEQLKSDGRKSRRIATKPKVDYAELSNLTESDLASLDESCNIADEDFSSSPKRTPRKSTSKANIAQTPEEKIKKSRKRKGALPTNEEVEQLYLTRGKTISNPDAVTNDLLETIFESPVSKSSGTPILLSRRRYRRTQTFPEKPWRPRPGKIKTGGRKKRGGPRKKNTMPVVDDDVLETHLNEVLADLSELSPVARSPKPVMTPFPKLYISQSRLGDTSQDE